VISRWGHLLKKEDFVRYEGLIHLGWIFSFEILHNQFLKGTFWNNLKLRVSKQAHDDPYKTSLWKESVANESYFKVKPLHVEPLLKPYPDLWLSPLLFSNYSNSLEFAVFHHPIRSQTLLWFLISWYFCSNSAFNLTCTRFALSGGEESFWRHFTKSEEPFQQFLIEIWILWGQ